MDPRNIESGASASPPTVLASPSVGYPSAGNPGGGQPAGVPGPYWYYQFSEELRNVIIQGALTPNDAVLTQLYDAILQIIADNTTGTVDASTTVKGVIELATNAEAITGTDTIRAIVPAALKAAVFDNVNSYTRQQLTPPVALTDAATIAWDLDVEPNATVTIAADRILGLPTNIRAGNIVNLSIRQDATGSRLISSWDSAFDFGDEGAPTLSVSANKYDVLSFFAVSTSKVRFLGIKRGFSS